MLDPHGQPVRGSLASMLYLSGFFLDYCAGVSASDSSLACHIQLGHFRSLLPRRARRSAAIQIWWPEMVRRDPQPSRSPTGSGDSAGCERRIDFGTKSRSVARRDRTPTKGISSPSIQPHESRFSEHRRPRRRIRFRIGGFGCGIYETQIRRAISWMVVISTSAVGRIGSVFVITAQHDVLHRTLRILLGVDDDRALPFLAERAARHQDIPRSSLRRVLPAEIAKTCPATVMHTRGPLRCSPRGEICDGCCRAPGSGAA